PPTRCEWHVVGGGEDVQLVAVVAADVKHLSALPFQAEPFEMHTPRVLAELEEERLLRPRFAVGPLAPLEAGDIRRLPGVSGRRFAVESSRGVRVGRRMVWGRSLIDHGADGVTRLAAARAAPGERFFLRRRAS